MPRIAYISQKFRKSSLQIIAYANRIIEDYAAQGLSLTLRQLYYRFVAADLITNNQKSYSRLGSIINDARLAGYLDWNAIEDRGRNLIRSSHWNSPADIIDTCARSYAIDKWRGQEFRVECLPPDQHVMTFNGPKPIGEVSPGELVLTHTGRWQEVTQVLRRPYKGPLITVRAAGCLPVRMTPNHPVFVRHWDQTKSGYKGARRKFLPEGFDRADALEKMDLLYVPAPVGESKVSLHELTCRGKNVQLQWDRDTRAMIGLYLAEGYVRKDERTTQFTVGTHEQKHINLLKQWARSVGLTASTFPDGGATQVLIYSSALAAWLRAEFGCGAFKKSLPQWLVEAPKLEQLEVLRWYFRGDGGVDSSTSTYAVTTRSRVLAEQVSMLLVRGGFLPALSEVEDLGKPRYRVAVSGASVVDLARLWDLEMPSVDRRYNHLRSVPGGMCVPVKSVTTEEFDGEVVNLEVAHDHTYCASFVVHNCWVEKQALEAVVGQAAELWDCPYFSCKGYTSQSEMWRAAQRFAEYRRQGQEPVIIHLGDHDPSGIDMTRDIDDRTNELFGVPVQVSRIALNMDQVEQYDPPPNYAKITDSRFASYQEEYGDESWELDALEPATLNELIQEHIQSYLDRDLWDQMVAKEEEGKQLLQEVSDHWDDVVDNLPSHQVSFAPKPKNKLTKKKSTKKRRTTKKKPAAKTTTHDSED